MSRESGFRAGGEGDDRRYWRRQANRRVRKARFTRNLARWSLILSLQLAFGSVVVYTGYRAWHRISDSPEFALKRIELVGAARANGDAVRRSLGPYLGGAVLELDLAEIERTVLQDPWVLDASLRRVLPDTLRIEVTERTPCAIAIIGGLAHVVDRQGFVIGPTGLQRPGDLPVLTGLPSASGGDAGGGGAHVLLAAELRRGVDLLERLRRASPGFLDEISEVDLSRRDRVTLRPVAPGPLLLLDPLRVERNVSSFLRLRPVMQGRFDTAVSVDLRWQDRVSVMPSEPAGAGAGEASDL